MDDVTIARAIHVLGVVLWIGGVAFVTTVLLPAIGRRHAAEDRFQAFEAIGRTFAMKSRATTLIVGLTGFHMTAAQDLWDRFLHLDFWWMHAMVLVWLIFTVMLFVAEPLFLHRWFEARARTRPEGTFRLIARMHWVLLWGSLVAVLGVVIGAHGGIGL
jgi:uncharacterized membrane protein